MKVNEKEKFSLRKNDQVQVMSGKQKGKTGKILAVNSKTGRVTVEKVNLVKKHTKATQQSAGGILEKELPLHYSKVLLHCPKCDRGVRHGIKISEEKGTKKVAGKTGAERKRVRVCKRCGDSLDLA